MENRVLYKNSLSSVISVTIEVTKSIALCFYGLLLGPLGVLRGPLALGLFFSYLYVLTPMKLLSPFVVLSINWRIGRFSLAIMQAEDIITDLEQALEKSPSSRRLRKVLEDIYTLLTRAYLHSGHIDDAMLVVLRAKKSLGIERLPGLAELNSKTAHLIRAGLSAGKLLDGGGLATLFVKTPTSNGAARPLENIEDKPNRQGASKKEKNDTHSAEIIPFPVSPKPQGPSEKT